MSETDTKLKQTVISCLEGNRDARIRFQDLFGDFIYNYPTKIFHLSNDRAADFYVYVFENDRIFKRLRGFEGRNEAQFKTYLGFYVLRDLFFEWQRNQKEVEVVSFETVVSRKESEGEGATLQDFIADAQDSKETVMGSQDEADQFKDAFASLDVEKRVLLKLLHLAEFDLGPQEIRFLCQKSGRRYKEAITIIEEIRIALRRKDEQFASLQDQLESIFGWILHYQKELTRLSEALKSATEGSSRHTELRREKEEFDRKLEWRYRQREQALSKARQFRVTTPYKDMARLLNVPLGTVCSLVARIRGEILKNFGNREVLEQATAS